MEILYIIFGWLLGLLSQPIVSKIEKHSKQKEIRNAIFSELQNIEIRLVVLCYKIQTHLGKNDMETLIWIKGIYKKYKGNFPHRLLDTFEKLSQAPDDQFDEIIRTSKAEDDISISPKKYSLPYTESILEYLSVFDSNFQKNIFDIRTQINFLNDDIENSSFYFRLTFKPSCMNLNKEIIRSNLNNCYNDIQERCKKIAERIDNVLGN